MVETAFVLPKSPTWLGIIRDFADAACDWEEAGFAPDVVNRSWRHQGMVLTFTFTMGAAPPPKQHRARCGARTRRGTSCRARVVIRENGTHARRCRNHGGLSRGPKTLAGRMAIRASNQRRGKAARQAARMEVGGMPEEASVPSPPGPGAGLSLEHQDRYTLLGSLLWEGELSREEIAAQFGVNRRTINRWQKHPLVLAVVQLQQEIYREEIRRQSEARWGLGTLSQG